jgi:hypothetical protein
LEHGIADEEPMLQAIRTHPIRQVPLREPAPIDQKYEGRQDEQHEVLHQNVLRYREQSGNIQGTFSIQGTLREHIAFRKQSGNIQQ